MLIDIDIADWSLLNLICESVAKKSHLNEVASKNVFVGIILI